MLYEIKRNKKDVDGVLVETWKREIVNANILEIEVGTTGYKGGDTGHGGRTYLSIKNLSSTDLNAYIINNDFGDTEKVVIELGGDTELGTFIEALEFAINVLKEQSKR